MISSIISRLVILLFGTLYPAYASYKAVRTKNVKEYGGGGIVNQLRKSYSLSDLSDPSHDREDGQDEGDIVTDPRLTRRRRSPHRTASVTSAIYFSEVDMRAGPITHIQSVEDISSGYSSSEGLYAGHPPKLQAREGLARTGSLTRSRTGRTTRSSTSRKSANEDSDESEVFDTNIIFLNDQAKPLDKLQKISSPPSSEDEFVDSVDSMHGNSKTVTSNTGELSSLTACRDVDVCSDNKNYTSLRTVVMNSKKEFELDEEYSEGRTIGVLKDNLEKIVKAENDLIKLIKNNLDKKCDTVDAIDLDKEKTVAESVDKMNVKTNTLIRASTDKRGGKYNKKAAPPPPSVPNSTNTARGNDSMKPNEVGSPTIKATLVLKPGVVKPIAPASSDNAGKEVFINSPKLKRKSLVNRTSSNSSFSKLLKLPSKIGFWNKESTNKEKIAVKRSSWHESGSKLMPKLCDSKIQSRSFNDLPRADDGLISLDKTNPKYSSTLSIKSLSESPLAKRRLKIIRRFVDEDID